MTVVDEIKQDLQVQNRIKNEIRKLNKTFKNLGNDKLKTVHSLIENAAFMSVILDELQQHIIKNGIVSEYQNGANQWGTKKSPEVEVYNSMLKNHLAIMKQLTDLLKEVNGEEEDELIKFINRRYD